MTTTEAVTLLHLPDEILDTVADHVAQTHAQRTLSSLALVCRRLVRIAQDRLFRDIHLQRARALRALSEALVRRPGLRAKVMSLTLSELSSSLLVDGRSSNSEYGGDRDRDSVSSAPMRQPTNQRTLLMGLLQLPTLKVLRLFDCRHSQLVTLLCDISTVQSVPLLRELSINSYRVTGQVERDDRFWRALSHFPLLEELDICPSDPIALVVPAGETLIFKHLATLAIPGDYLVAETPAFASIFPVLRSLELGGPCTTQHLRHALGTAPENLRRLLIRSGNDDLQAERYLPRYAKLEELQLCAGFTPFAVLPILQASSIHTLSFTEGCELPDRFLLDLVDGPNRMKSLRHLTLNHGGPRPLETDIYDELYDYMYNADDLTVHARAAEAHAELGFSWPANQTEEGLAHAIAAAEENGIEVGGMARNCIGWTAHFDNELERSLVDRAMQANNLKALIRYYGRQGAAAAIRRHRSELAELLAE